MLKVKGQSCYVPAQYMHSYIIIIDHNLCMIENANMNMLTSESTKIPPQFRIGSVDSCQPGSQIAQ